MLLFHSSASTNNLAAGVGAVRGIKPPPHKAAAFHQRFVPAAFFHQLDELDRIACAGIAVAAEAAIRIGLGVNLQARRLVRVEGQCSRSFRSGFRL